ncbi:protein C2-DOMAIN ABA-RELATED 7 isoform X2 [Populus trichocarpa]|uniref:protein C2-DOMAIN ABA-RELATED 7 isoform X2 n=1 Tax=Populus trichocarpa TaxID=3694 RepID=UPI000D189436|nr:protein C2-DOMAIN ABA-RELATED 7 isoform X2 [Populus trichocarpa]|eukprot:XP_024461877.1 protein C2-DOMAIN ABA-RELATED 7 isoform X2 [Populus trichocarpa]
MDSFLGLLRIRVKRGVNLAVRDLGSSDPYVVITMGNQKLKTRVVKKNCNPVWNEELTLSITDLNVPINLTVFDKDTFTVDDKMGEAGIDLQPYIASLKMGLQNLPKGCVVSRVQPSQNNCLADESCIVWDDGKLHQDMILRLRNVESGEVTIQIEWIDVPGCRGLKTEGKHHGTG